MSGKTESSSAGKKSEPGAKKPADKSPQGMAPAEPGYESYLGEGQPSIDSLNDYLEGADDSTRAQVITDLQQNQGNEFVQRLMIQRQEHGRGSSFGDPGQSDEAIRRTL